MDCSEGCPRAAVIFGVQGVRVLGAESDDRGLQLMVETDQQVEGCRDWRRPRGVSASLLTSAAASAGSR